MPKNVSPFVVRVIAVNGVEAPDRELLKPETLVPKVSEPKRFTDGEINDKPPPRRMNAATPIRPQAMMLAPGVAVVTNRPGLLSVGGVVMTPRELNEYDHW